MIAGEAAHITAASVNGPRFDPSLIPERRSSYENGIWLCVLCARIIDKDQGSYSSELLRTWKALRERNSAAEVAAGARAPAGLRFQPFFHEEVRSFVIQGSRLGQHAPVRMFGRATIGVVVNEGPAVIRGLSAKAIAPSGRVIPLEVSQTDINPGDTAEFRLCMSAAAGGPDCFVVVVAGRRLEVDGDHAELGEFLEGGELLYPMPEIAEVGIRVTSNDGDSVSETLQLTRIECLDLDLPRWGELDHASGEFTIAIPGNSKVSPPDFAGDKTGILLDTSPPTRVAIRKLTLHGMGASGEKAHALEAVVRMALEGPIPAGVVQQFLPAAPNREVYLPYADVETHEFQGQVVCQGIAKTHFAWFVACAVSSVGSSDIVYLLDWHGPAKLAHHPAGFMLHSFTINDEQ